MRKSLKYICLLALSGTMLLGSTVSSYAANFTRVGEALSDGSKLYYLNHLGGVKAYSRYTNSLKYNKAAIGQAMLNGIPGAGSGYGDTASRAAFRYKNYEGIKSGAQYLTKMSSLDGSLKSSYVWYRAPYDIGETYNVNFRYVGIAITGKNPNSNSVDGIPATNPNFTSDSISESSSAGEMINAGIWNNNSWNFEVKQAYGSKSEVIPLNWLYTNGHDGTSVYTGKGNIKTNKASNINNDPRLAQMAFEKWAASTDYGRDYLTMANDAAEVEKANGVPNQTGWNVLNRFFQIAGDPTDDEQSLFFYCVYKVGGKDYYRTYTIPAPMQSNVAPTRFVIRDENDKVIGNAYRNPIQLYAYGGTGDPIEPVQPIQLQRGKTYKIDVIMSYYNRDDNRGSNTTNRSANFFALTPNSSGARDTSIPQLNTASSIDKSGLSDEYAQYISPDGKAGGQIDTDYYVYSVDTPDKVEYWCGDAAFNNSVFTVGENMPVSGKLVAEVPDEYNMRGDNDNQMDDEIAIKYIIVDSENPDPVPPTSEAYGDMNIGQREYRRLHWYETEEVEDPDSPITDPATGEVTGYETKTITMEHVSSYGTWEDTNTDDDESWEVDDTSHEVDDKDRFDAGGDMWWEYAQEWPDQTEDLDWKVWMERNGQWQEDGHYIRSETVDEPFDLGFYISRSRGKEGVVESPTLDVNIYGISPDTGEDGELIANMSNMQLTTPGLSVYTLAKNYLKGLYVGEKYNGVADYPRIRVDAKISDKHGESGIYGDARKQPYNNGWQDEHDTVSREFLAEEDDMRIMEVELKDSEGVVVYHADRYGSDNMDVTVNGHFDREEDLTMKVVVEQNLSSGHNVKNPTIDVRIDGLTETGNTVSTYVDQVLTLDGVEMGEGVQVTFDNISFRPKNVQKLSLNVQIDDIHGENNWRENIWDDSDDSYNDIITCTTADMSLTQDIELYNSKHNKQEYLTFAEYLSFKFNIRHIGNSERQMMVVGNSKINPLAKLNTRIYNADALTVDPHTQKLVYQMASEDPKATKALISEQDIQAKTRLFPGLGLNGYASHVQAWIKKYIVQSWKTPSGNVAAYGHILVSGIIDQQHDINYTNIRDNTVDYVQKEFKGEKDFRIEDITATAQNSISDKTGVSVQVAISNIASSYNDQTVIDKTYLDIYIDDERKTTSIIEVPTGETIITEIIIPEVDLEDCKVIEARVNTGTHQTHYEYVLKETNEALHADPFTNNYESTIVCANKPSETACPQCILKEGQNEVKDIFAGDGN